MHREVEGKSGFNWPPPKTGRLMNALRLHAIVHRRKRKRESKNKQIIIVSARCSFQVIALFLIWVVVVAVGGSPV